MKNILLLSIFILTGFTVSAQETSQQQDRPDTLNYPAIAQEFSSTLQGILMAELKKGGTLGAVSVCSDTALKLTGEIGNKYGVKIKRISDKNRNAKNAPANEKEVMILQVLLEEHSLLSAEEKDEDAIKALNIKKEKIKTPGLFFTPMKTAGACIQCHGNEDQIAPATLQKINELYPHDKARGYKAGDFRGAIVIEKK